MTVSEYIYQTLTAAFPGNVVKYDYFPQSVDLKTLTPNVLVRDITIDPETTKSGEAGDIASYQVEIIAHRDAKLTCLTLSREIRDELTAITDTNDIREIELETQFSDVDKAENNVNELTRITQLYRVHINPYTI